MFCWRMSWRNERGIKGLDYWKKLKSTFNSSRREEEVENCREDNSPYLQSREQMNRLFFTAGPSKTGLSAQRQSDQRYRSEHTPSSGYAAMLARRQPMRGLKSRLGL